MADAVAPALGTFFLDAFADMVLVQKLHGPTYNPTAVDVRFVSTRDHETLDLRSWLERGFVGLERAVRGPRR
jgi:hypothetical protein